MKRLRVCILAVVFMCLAAGDIFAVRMVESQNPTQAAPAEVKPRQEALRPGMEQPVQNMDAPENTPVRAAKRSSAQEENGNTSGKNAQYVTMDFDGVDIAMMIKFIADLTKKNFIVDPSVSGKVTVISPRKMTVDEAYRVFESVLEVNGFTTVPMGNVTKIMKSSDAVTKGVETKTGVQALKVDKLVTQLIPLKYADCEDIKNLLTPLMSRGASQILSYAQSNILIVTDTLSNIRKFLDIIKVLDVAGFAQDVKIAHLKHATAADLAAKLNQIISGTAADAQRIQARRITRGGASGKEPPKIIANERTNSLILMATTQDMQMIEDLIAQLDIPTPSGKEDIHVYYLQHANAEEVAKVLSGMPTPISPEAAPAAGVQPGARAASGTGQQNFKISPDKATNSLIIFGDPYTYSSVVETIKYLDIPRKQVFVKAFLMEVNTSKDFKLGVEWTAFEDFTYDSGDRTGGVFARSGAGFVSSLADLPSGSLLGVIGEAITINKGGTEITFPNLTSFINAMAQDVDVNIISTPQIITMDNKEAQIKVGKNVPYLTRQDTDSTNINRTVNTYDYRDVGVDLKITPQINQEGNIRLDLFQEITQLVAGTGDAQFAPTTLKRTATTTVTVKDGTTMVIGGLIGETLTMGEYRVPLLGKIPLLGWLFKTDTRSRERTNLYIFLTPVIIDTDEKANALYKEKYGTITRMKEAFDKGKEGATPITPEEKLNLAPRENGPEQAAPPQAPAVEPEALPLAPQAPAAPAQEERPKGPGADAGAGAPVPAGPGQTNAPEVKIDAHTQP